MIKVGLVIIRIHFCIVPKIGKNAGSQIGELI